MDLLAAIETERLEIADTLETLTPEQCKAPSCCAGWTVLDVAAHLTQGWNYTRRHGLFEIIKARGDLGVVSARCLAPLAAAGSAAVVADLRAHATDRFRPPGLGLEAPLNDLVIHRRDMFLALGIDSPSHPDSIRVSLDLSVRGGIVKMVNARSCLAGLRCVATDLDWSWGDGDELCGPSLPLAHAMWGRSTSLRELSGPGVGLLSQRLAARSATKRVPSGREVLG